MCFALLFLTIWCPGILHKEPSPSFCLTCSNPPEQWPIEIERTVFYFYDDQMPCETNYMENLHWTFVSVKTPEQWHVERTGLLEYYQVKKMWTLGLRSNVTVTVTDQFVCVFLWMHVYVNACMCVCISSFHIQPTFTFWGFISQWCQVLYNLLEFLLASIIELWNLCPTCINQLLWKIPGDLQNVFR